LATNQEQLLQMARLISRAHRGLHCLVQPRLEQQGSLTVTEMMVVRLVKEEGSPRASYISDKLGIPPSTMTSILDRLEAKGVVRRVRHVDDRRAVLVQLEDGAAEVKKEFETVLARELSLVFGDISPDKLKEITANLEFITQKLQPKR